MLYTMEEARTDSKLINSKIGFNNWRKICLSEIPYLPIGRKKLFDEKDIKEWLQKNKSNSTKEKPKISLEFESYLERSS